MKVSQTDKITVSGMEIYNSKCIGSICVYCNILQQPHKANTERSFYQNYSTISKRHLENVIQFEIQKMPQHKLY